MTGLADAADAEASRNDRRAVAHAAERLAERGLDLPLEPADARSMPGSFLNDVGRARDVVADVGIPGVKLQFDLFHRQIMLGDVTMSLQHLMPVVGHAQVAGVPRRHEPDDGEPNVPDLVSERERLGHDGFVGCECDPRGRTVDGLGRSQPYRRR